MMDPFPSLVVVLHDAVEGSHAPDEIDTIQQATEITEALTQLGFNSKMLPFNKEALTKDPPPFVFNLVESTTNNNMFSAVGLLEELKIPFTGNNRSAITTTTDKVLTKSVLKKHHLPTPKGHDDFAPGQFIIKPVSDEASIGIDSESVVSMQSKDELIKLIKQREEKFKFPFFAEQFLDGREFNVSLLMGDNGPEILPPAEMLFLHFSENQPRILDYQAKWDVDSFEYKNTVRTFQFKQKDEELLKSLKNISRKCWDILELKGYARVDFRLDQDDNPYILEVNANPCLSKDAGFMAAATEAGLSYLEVISRILKHASV